MTLEDLLKKNRHFRNMHAGKRCFIVGNGPSIKTQNLTLLQNEVSIVVSSFFRHSDAKKILPKFWVLADPLFWEKPSEFLSPVFSDVIEKAIDVNLFVPSGGAQVFLKTNAGPLINLHFFHYDRSKDINSIIDFAGGVPPFGQNVVIVSLMLAFYLGCNPIYVIGCDHDFMKVTKEEYENIKVDHFYENPTQNKCSEHLTWNQWQAAMARMNYEYNQLKQYAALWGFDVYNATPGGHLDPFPRVQYESLFVHAIDFLGRGERHSHEADTMALTKNAVKLMNEGSAGSALVLLEAALRSNLNTRQKVYGLEYLKTLCLARLNRYTEAIMCARQYRECTPANRENIDVLIKQLENACSVQTLTGMQAGKIHYTKELK